MAFLNLSEGGLVCYTRPDEEKGGSTATKDECLSFSCEIDSINLFTLPFMVHRPQKSGESDTAHFYGESFSLNLLALKQTSVLGSVASEKLLLNRTQEEQMR